MVHRLISEKPKNIPVAGKRQMAKVLIFEKPSLSLTKRVRKELIGLRATGAMMAYIQTNLPALRRELGLGSVRLDIIHDDIQGVFVVYLHADFPGLPLTAQGTCERSCLVSIAEQFCSIKPLEKGEGARPVVGVSPVRVKPMDEFGGTK